MPRFEFRSFVIVEDEDVTDATQAREAAETFCGEVNKSPDTPHVYLAGMGDPKEWQDAD